MDKELQKYYEETFSMMSTQGWSFLLEDLEKLKQELENIRTVKDAQSLSYRQGQLDILDLILNRKKTCEEVYEQLQQEAQSLVFQHPHQRPSLLPQHYVTTAVRYRQLIAR